MNHKLRILGFSVTLILIVGVAVFGIKGLIKNDPLREIDDYQAWSPELIKEANSIPIQNDGRIKPLQTYADTLMLAMHGQRGMKILVKGKKVKISSTAWLLDVIFRPEQANKLPTFRLDNSKIIAQLGAETKDLRDRYSFNDLEPYLKEIDKEMFNIRKQKLTKDQLTQSQQQLVDLSDLLSNYLQLRNPFKVNPKAAKSIGLKKVSELFKLRSAMVMPENPDASSIIEAMDKISVNYGRLNRQVNFSGSLSPLSWIPPTDKNIEVWYSVGKEFSKIAKPSDEAFSQYSQRKAQLLEELGTPSGETANEFLGKFSPIFKEYFHVYSQPHPAHVQEGLIEMENLQEALLSGGPATRLKALKTFKSKQVKIMKSRGEGKEIASEVFHNNANYFNNSLVFIILSFLLVVISCILIGTKFYKPLYWTAFGSAVLGTIIVSAGITHRSIIMGRAPIGNLYDTMPFIVAASLIILLFLERINKKGILLAVATLLGIGGILLAKMYETSQAVDNLSPLRAVLKSNYWLTIHVITITIGYAGGLITAMISLLFILGRIFGIVDDRETRKSLTGIVYGMIAFTLVFSLIGTILGGIWAADSWGRFWGWDPKENGALLIVIWVLAVLHARIGGFIKEMGLHCCGLFTAAVVVFSWWHVNFLGVGLHNYGFTSADAMFWLWVFYAGIGITILGGIIFSFIEKENKKMRRTPPPLDQARTPPSNTPNSQDTQRASGYDPDHTPQIHEL